MKPNSVSNFVAVVALVASHLLIVQSVYAEARTWTATDGRTVVAEYISADNNYPLVVGLHGKVTDDPEVHKWLFEQRNG